MPKPIPAKVVYKAATIENTGPDDAFPGTFKVALSVPTEDRDGDTLLPTEWKLPLPDHITFDVDHGMTVEKTVGSGVPAIEEATGRLIVEGTYSSRDLAQETRTLVNEGHIRTTSVAFMTVPSGKTVGKTVRELLNGAFVAVPSNREALVLESKSAMSKAGARNSSTDAQRIQQIHDLALELGAASDVSTDAGADDDDDETKAFKRAKARQIKSIDGSIEQLQERIREALREVYKGWIWLRATVPTGEGAGYVVFDVEDPDTYDSETYRESYSYDGTTVTLAGDREAVEVAELVIPEASATDAAAESPAAGAAAPAAGDKAAADAAELQVKAAQFRALAQLNEGDT